jgi:hypothetical protein
LASRGWFSDRRNMVFHGNGFIALTRNRDFQPCPAVPQLQDFEGKDLR